MMEIWERALEDVNELSIASSTNRMGWWKVSRETRFL